MRSPTAAFITLGCKINQYETEAIREEVVAQGWREVPSHDAADVYVVNTCSVTSMAGAKSRKAILRAARRNPEARVYVVGCSTPPERDRIRQIPQVEFVAGNEAKARVAALITGAAPVAAGGAASGSDGAPADAAPAAPPTGGAPERRLLDLDISRFRDRTRATVKVQDGCDNFCSFCIIPHLRGTSKSREAAAVVDEVARLVAAGWREVVISGVHLQDWGGDLASRSTLPRLLERVAQVPGLARVRLSSLGARAFTDDLLDVLEHPVFCRHWHVPLQAGDDAVLEIMRRGYSVADFRGAIDRLRARFEDPGITTDIIVGHPGETDEVFERSLALYRELGFAKIHAFPFSFREGTLSEKLWRGGAVDPREIRRRSKALAEVEETSARRWREGFLGREVEVLVEGPVRRREGWLEGLTDRYLRVAFPAPSREASRRFPGTLRRVRVTAVTDAGADAVWAETPRLEEVV